MTERREIAIHVPVLARVEGEGALTITIQDGQLTDLRLRIFEPPRYFEKFLEGRDFREVPDIVARICGICPVAYQMSAVQALESLLGIDPGPWVRAMRRVFYCGEWIQSHSLHIHLLALPDFLGFDNVVAMAGRHGDVVRRGMRLQALGNDLMRLFGGRSVHPVGARVGGFHHAPAPAVVAQLVQRLAAALPDAEALARWVAALPLPEVEQRFTNVALVHAKHYPLEDGRIASDDGLDIDRTEFDQHFTETQVPHSTALYCQLRGQPYLVGPLARLNLNHARLPAATRSLLAGLPVSFPSANLFYSIVARAVEIHAALNEALRLLSQYTMPDSPFVEMKVRAGVGYGATEAPRGLLWHRYQIDDAGLVRAARIVPPTSQNQSRIEEDLRASLEQFGLARPPEELRRHAETVIRNYDPCISCATHFLDLTVTRR